MKFDKTIMTVMNESSPTDVAKVLKQFDKLLLKIQKLGDSDITSKAEELYNILKYKSNG
jgi:hypothetical protein